MLQTIQGDIPRPWRAVCLKREDPGETCDDNFLLVVVYQSFLSVSIRRCLSLGCVLGWVWVAVPAGRRRASLTRHSADTSQHMLPPPAEGLLTTKHYRNAGVRYVCSRNFECRYAVTRCAYLILLPITIPPPATPAVTSIGQRQRPGMIHPCALSAGRDYGRTQYHHIER